MWHFFSNSPLPPWTFTITPSLPALRCCWQGPQTAKQPRCVKPTCLQTNRLGRRGAAWPAWRQSRQTLTWGAPTAARAIPLPSSQVTNQHSTPAGRQLRSPLSTARRICSDVSKKYQFVCRSIDIYFIFQKISYYPDTLCMLCIWDGF